MAVPDSRSPKIPDSVSRLDIAVVAETLVKHAANVRSGVAELRVPAGDLRRLTMVNETLICAALEVEELRLDEAEANVLEALRSDATAAVATRRATSSSSTTPRSKQRGWIPSSAASVDVALAADLPPRRIVVSWRNPGDDKPDKREASDDDGWETIERDGQTIRVPRYDGARRDDDIEGELSLPATMLEHAAAVASPSPSRLLHRRWKLCQLCLNRSPPPSVTSASGSTPGFAIASSPSRSPPVSVVVSRSSRELAWEEVSNGDTNARARFHRTCHAEWRSEREAAARQALGLEG